jgi:hypothetical protein
MYESNCSLPWINQKNRTAVGNINAEKHVAITSDDRIDSRTFGRRSDRHDSDFVAMNLFSQPGLARKKSSSDALMIKVQPAKSGRSIASDIEAGDSQRKAVQNKFQAAEGWEKLHRNVSHWWSRLCLPEG